MEHMLYRIGEASTQLGLHDKNSNTLRSWVEEFKDFLGSSANPEAGKPRFFTEDDMRVLRAVRDLRANHLPYMEIKSRLAQGTHAVEQPAPAAEDPVPARENALVAVEQIQGLLAPMSRAADEWRGVAEQYRTRLEDREARVASLEQRVDSLQARLEELYSDAIKRQDLTPQPTIAPLQPTRAPVRRRRWLFLF